MLAVAIFDLNSGQVSEYLVDDSIQIEERREVFRYYGTCTKTLLTMFEAAVHFFLYNLVLVCFGHSHGTLFKSLRLFCSPLAQWPNVCGLSEARRITKGHMLVHLKASWCKCM